MPGDVSVTAVVNASRRPRFRVRSRLIGALLAFSLTITASLWAAGFRPSDLWAKRAERYQTLRVGEGEVALVVVESGVLESAINIPIRCQVEALLGQVGGGQPGMGTGGGGAGGTAKGGGGTRGRGGLNTAGGATAGGAAAVQATVAAPKATSSTAAKKVTGKSASAVSKAAGAAAGANPNAASAGQTATAAAGAGGAAQRPTIRSFSYVVTPHVALRGAAAATTQAATKANAQAAGGAPAGGRGGGNMMSTRTGSTRILSIVPEGTAVKAGDVVCELDAAAFRDELQSELIRHAQAKSWVDQAHVLIKVSQISRREYIEGILPKDLEQINKYIDVCKTQKKQAQVNLTWTQRMAAENLISPSQLRACQYALQQAEITLSEAEGMLERLTKYTAPRLIANLDAKIAAVRADALAQEASFALEDDRKRRIEKNIEHCKMRAPRDGIVVYAQPAQRRGNTGDQIGQGATVREGQAIYSLPDPSHMHVRARIHETKMAYVREGHPVSVAIDAFPGHLLKGVVTEVTAIPAPANGPFSDVKQYFAMVDITDTGGIDELKPGLSAEVSFLMEKHEKVTRVPVSSIRWMDNQPLVAIAGPNGPNWRAVTLGLIDPAFAEVTSGLKAGETIIAEPSKLPEPDVAPASGASSVASSGEIASRSSS